MEENENIIVIGHRGKAVARIVKVVWQFILATGFFIGFFSILLSILNSGDPSIFGIVSLILFYLPLPALFVFLGVRNIVFATKNNARMDIPVLSYDKEKDVFYCCDRLGHPLIIPNGNIIALSGSKKRSDRELRMQYIDDLGMMKRTCIGFCRNIDHNAVKILLNQYHRPPVR